MNYNQTTVEEILDTALAQTMRKENPEENLKLALRRVSTAHHCLLQALAALKQNNILMTRLFMELAIGDINENALNIANSISCRFCPPLQESNSRSKRDKRNGKK